MHPSVGHGQGGRPSSMRGLAPGLEIRGVSGMRLPQVLGRQHEANEDQRPISLAERVAQALRDLQDIARARADLATQRIRAGLEWAQAELGRAGETVPLRQWITKAVLQVRALRAAILGRALRLVSLGRAERLHHLAQHEWERFNTDYPMGTNGYSPRMDAAPGAPPVCAGATDQGAGEGRRAPPRHWRRSMRMFFVERPNWRPCLRRHSSS